MRKFGIHGVKVIVKKPNGEKYVGKTELTEELVNGGNMDIVSAESYKTLTSALNEAYDSVEFHHGEPGVTNRLERELLWEKVKNVNTDEELEEIRQLLRVKDENL